MSQKFIIIETTSSSIEEAEKITKILLNKKLAGCIEFKKITSFYFWQGENHSYQTPQIIAIAIENIDANYGNWLNSCIDQ